MADSFGTVVIIVAVIAAIAGIVAYAGSGKLYEGIGKGAFSLDEPDRPSGPAPGSAAARAEAEAEIRQLVEAKSERRQARGETPLDVEAEVAALTRPPAPHDDALRDEVRQLVIARNERRLRRGQEPLDVETEVERQLQDLA